MQPQKVNKSILALVLATSAVGTAQASGSYLNHKNSGTLKSSPSEVVDKSLLYQL